MKETAFLNWLIENGKKENSARSTVSRIKRIEEVYPDLDSRYEDDSLETLLSVLTYTKKDEAKNREPLHNQVIQNAKTLSDLHAIRQHAQSAKDNVSVNYLVEEVLSVFKD